MFNAEKYLTGCLESVSNQSFHSAEHIVVDGGSTDGTLDILKHNSARWISEPDDGMYDAINKGLNLASGEIVGYINADDRYYPDSLSIVQERFRTNPEIDFVCGYCTYIDEQGRKLATFRPSPMAFRFLGNVRITFAQPTVFWRKRVLSEIGLFNAEYKTAGDAEFFYRLLNGPYLGQLIKLPLAKFTVRADSLSAVMNREMGSEIANIRSENGINRFGPFNKR